MTLIVIALCIIIAALLYFLYTKEPRKVIKVPEDKKKELPESVSFLLEELNNSGVANYSDLREQLDIIMQYTYIFDENVIGLKIKE